MDVIEFAIEQIKDKDKEIQELRALIVEAVRYTHWYIQSSVLLLEMPSDLDEEEIENEEDNIQRAQSFLSRDDVKAILEKEGEMSRFGLDEYTPEEIAVNSNGLYGGKRHDKICEYLQTSYNFSETQINDISVGVWLAIENERAVGEGKLIRLQKEKEILIHALDSVYLFGKCLVSRDYARAAIEKIKALDKMGF